MRSRRLAVPTTLVVTILAATQLAAGAPSQFPDRMPRVKPARVLPSAGGLILGQTTKARLLARWGQAARCSPTPSCSWSAGYGPNARPRRGEAADAVTVVFHDRTGRAHDLGLVTSSWRKSRLARGWKMPEGVGIGSAFPAVRRAYPAIRWRGSGAANTSSWTVPSYERAGNRYTLLFTFDRATREVAKGHVLTFGLVWLLPRISCALSIETVPAPADAVAGRRIRGACKGASLYHEWLQTRNPLDMRFTGTQGAQVTSASSPFDPSCRASFCTTRTADWAVDVTLGVSAPDARVEVRLRHPSAPLAAADEIRITLD